MIDKRTICCFTGHRPEKLPWGTDESDPRCAALKRRLDDVIRTAYEEGMRHFICGMARGSDLYCAELVLALRQEKGDVVLEAAIPCLSQASGWPREDRARWQAILDACDLETVVQEQYTPGCMQRRNRYMVDHCALVIAVYDGTAGGTRQTLQYAMKKGVPFIDINPV